GREGAAGVGRHHEAARLPVLEVGVGPVDAAAVRPEEAEAEYEIRDGRRRAHAQGQGEGLAGGVDVPLAAAAVDEAHPGDLDLAAAPAARLVAADRGLAGRG